MADQLRTESKEIVVKSGDGNGETHHAAEAPPGSPSAQSSAAVAHPPRFSRRAVGLAVIAVAAAALIVLVGIPWLMRVFTTASTDDAYVNGHVTFVAPRISGQVVSVLVDDNIHVHKGDVLVQLDREPYQIALDAKRAAFDLAVANLRAAQDNYRAMVGNARAARFKLDHAMEDVRNQISTLKAKVAELASAKANLALADADYKRALKQEMTPGVISPQEVDHYKAAYLVAQAQVELALQQVYEVRVSLGLPEQPKSGDLTEVPRDLDQTFSTVRQALFQLIQIAAPLGIVPTSFNLTPKQLLDEFYKLDPSGNIDKIFAKLIVNAPTIKFAEANQDQARADLDQAELNLRYCDIVAEIDGVVTRRNINPGNNVIAGQQMMAVRSLTEIWIDANFKETQLAPLRIGQPVDIEVDMYGGRRIFKGRIEGFTYGTGSTLALLPPENATGNFVKVVQRLPVRIELVDYDYENGPLYTGLSVTPYVLVNQPPTGPDAGKIVQPWSPTAPETSPTATRPPTSTPPAATTSPPTPTPPSAATAPVEKQP